MLAEDRDIISKVRNGHVESFRYLIERYKDKAFSLALRILKNRNEAEDSVQDAFMKAYRAITSGNYEETAKFSTYFYTIVYNTAVDYYRRYYMKNLNIVSIEVTDSMYSTGDEINKSYYGASVIPESESAEKTINDADIKLIIEKYVASIPEQYSVILNLFFINDLSHDEISKILKIPVGTVKNRIFRAKEKLKEILLKEFSRQELLEYIK